MSLFHRRSGVPALLISSLCGLTFLTVARAEDKPAAPAAGTPCRVWMVPRDLTDHYSKSAPPGGGPALPFVIPAMGTFPPADVRDVFRSLGVKFKKEDRALFSKTRTGSSMLFVRAGTEALALMDTILNLEGLRSDAEITFTLRRIKADGSTRDLIQRTLSVPYAERTKFQRHRDGKLVEEEEMEVVVGEDGKTIDVNMALDFHLKHNQVKFSGQSLLRGGDKTGLVVYTARDHSGASRLEVSVSGKVIPRSRLQPGISLTQLEREIDTQLTARETSAMVKSSDIYYVNEPRHFLESQERKDGPASGGDTDRKIEVSLSPGKQTLMDATRALKAMKVPLEDGDMAWYAPDKEWLYLRAGAATLSAAAGTVAAASRIDELRQMEVRFDSGADAAGKKTKRAFLPRTILVRSNQRASASAAGKSGQTEKMEVEASVSEMGDVATVDATLEGFSMGRETWFLWQKALTTTDGTSPIPLVSGTSRDTGGRMKYLTVSSQLRYGRESDVILDPVRKGVFLRELEAALEKSR